MKQSFTNKSILLIGGTGSIGKGILKELMSCSPKVIRVYSRDEHKQFILQQEIGTHKNIRFLIGDVRDKERLSRAVQDIDIIFNLAAMKHVPASEYNPFEAVKTNVIGVQNTIEAAIEHKVKKVIYTSSDKAVSPTNTMGATKLLAERLISAANFSKGGKLPVFSAVRFGNVMGSRGSVIPLWRKQIIKDRQITITDPNMTRFMMTINESVNLTLKACEKAAGGEIFVLKMPVIKLGDLAEVVIEEVCKEEGILREEVSLKIIGLRPGEKMYEELMTEDESLYSIEHEEMFALQPLTKYPDHIINDLRSYRSSCEAPISKEEIRELLSNINLKGDIDG